MFADRFLSSAVVLFSVSLFFLKPGYTENKTINDHLTDLIYDECIASAPAQELESCYDKAWGYAQGRIMEGCTGFNEGVIWALSKGNLQPFMPPILRRMCINHSDEVLQEELLIDDLNSVQRTVRYIIDNIRYEALEDYMESTRQGRKDATKNEEA